MKSPKQYRKKPVVIDAIEWTGGNFASVDLFAAQSSREVRQEGSSLIIPTLEGDHEASLGDMIIKGVQGELYPCKPDIFAATYDPA